jgi:thiosulfate/3-mercaptopyruvate sulfurtransferase
MGSEAVVSTDWLATHLADAALVVIDASVEKAATAANSSVWKSGRSSFEHNGHIPGARFADLGADFSDPTAPFAFTRPQAVQFAEAAGRLGLSGRERIVVYDDATGIWAARLWWLFRSFGHDDIAVLDGGLKAWSSANLPLEHGPAAVVARSEFPVRPRKGFFVDKDEVRAIVEGRTPGVLVCVLRPPVFAGTEQTYARPGHIPGSINLPFGELLDADNRFLPADALRRQLAPLIESKERVVAYCGGGITAAGTALALSIFGADNVTVYDGSLSEWSADPTLPMTVASAS